MNNQVFIWRLQTMQGTRAFVVVARDRFQAEQILRQQAGSDAVRLAREQPQILGEGSLVTFDEPRINHGGGYGMGFGGGSSSIGAY